MPAPLTGRNRLYHSIVYSLVYSDLTKGVLFTDLLLLQAHCAIRHKKCPSFVRHNPYKIRTKESIKYKIQMAWGCLLGGTGKCHQLVGAHSEDYYWPTGRAWYIWAISLKRNVCLSIYEQITRQVLQRPKSRKIRARECKPTRYFWS